MNLLLICLLSAYAAAAPSIISAPHSVYGLPTIETPVHHEAPVTVIEPSLDYGLPATGPAFTGEIPFAPISAPLTPSLPLSPDCLFTPAIQQAYPSFVFNEPIRRIVPSLTLPFGLPAPSLIEHPHTALFAELPRPEYGLPIAERPVFTPELPELPVVPELPIVPDRPYAPPTVVAEVPVEKPFVPQPEYGLPLVEEKPVFIPTAPALPELPVLPNPPVVVPAVPDYPYAPPTVVAEIPIEKPIEPQPVYGLPVEEKPILIPTPPELPELPVLPDRPYAPPVIVEEIKPVVPHAEYGPPAEKVPDFHEPLPVVVEEPKPVVLAPYGDKVISHYGEMVQIPRIHLVNFKK